VVLFEGRDAAGKGGTIKRYVLSHFDYANKDYEVVGIPDSQIVGPASLAVEGADMSPRIFPRL
jgi:hypothetical protein